MFVFELDISGTRNKHATTVLGKTQVTESAFKLEPDSCFTEFSDFLVVTFVKV